MTDLVGLYPFRIKRILDGKVESTGYGFGRGTEQFLDLHKRLDAQYDRRPFGYLVDLIEIEEFNRIHRTNYRLAERAS